MNTNVEENIENYVKWLDEWPDPSKSVANIIFDTDIGPDYDDTGVAAMLHNYANEGKANILATLCCVSAPFGAPYLNILNKYFGRPNIPVGTLKSKTNILPTCRGFCFTITQFSEYESDILDGLHARDAVKVYREVLSNQPDNSVTILATGMLSNLYDLLESKPDEYSELSGFELVSQKVKLVSVMGGKWPIGSEFNFQHDIDAAKCVIDKWPTPMVFSGYEVGVEVKTGNRLEETEPDNPLRTGGYHSNMSSWDLTSAMYAVEGLRDCFSLVRGDAYINGFDNGFINNEESGARAYLTFNNSPDYIASILEEYLVAPRKNNPNEILVKGIDSFNAVQEGEWEKYQPHDYFHNYSTLKTTTAKASLEISFNGDGVDVYGGISSENGKFAVYIDDILTEVIDTYSEKAIDTVCIYSNHNLKKSNHKLKIIVLDEKNDLSANIGGTIDFFKIINCD